MSVPAPPNLALVESGVQSDSFIRTRFLGEISIEKCMAFCPYRMDGRRPGAHKIFLADALPNISPEISIEESLRAIPISLLSIPLVFITSFKLLETLPEA